MPNRGAAGRNSERSAQPPAEQLTPEQLAEARRITQELAKLRAARAISGPDDPEADFFAHLLRDFGATFTGHDRPEPEPESDAPF